MDRRGFLKLLGIAPILPLLGTQNAAEQSSNKPMYLGEFSVAGFQYHDGMQESVFSSLNVEDELIIEREPENPYDRKALMIMTSDRRMLGYIPRLQNEIPANLSEQGIQFKACISLLERDAEPWERLKIRLWADFGRIQGEYKKRVRLRSLETS